MSEPKKETENEKKDQEQKDIKNPTHRRGAYNRKL